MKFSRIQIAGTVLFLLGVIELGIDFNGTSFFDGDPPVRVLSCLLIGIIFFMIARILYKRKNLGHLCMTFYGLFTCIGLCELLGYTFNQIVPFEYNFPIRGTLLLLSALGLLVFKALQISNQKTASR
jgi:hypothetical protein